MTRFYFDSDDGERQFLDEDGIELAGLRDVADQVLGLLHDLMPVTMPHGSRVIAASVRDITGALVYRAELRLVSQHLDDHQRSGAETLSQTSSSVSQAQGRL